MPSRSLQGEDTAEGDGRQQESSSNGPRDVWTETRVFQRQNLKDFVIH